MDHGSTRSERKTNEPQFPRRRILKIGGGLLAGAAIAGVGGVELVDHGVLPGQSLLNSLDGACEVPARRLSFGEVGRTLTGSFYSTRRHVTVSYSIGLPASFLKGQRTSLAIFLHGEFASHRAWLGVSDNPAQAAALLQDGQPMAPMAIATIDGGKHYWHAYGNDDPMAMVVDEFIPFCQSLGLGVEPGTVGVMGLSMGGYGALLFAEKHPSVFSAAAALSPGIWTSYRQARAANAVAYSSMSNFARYDVVTHTPALARTPTFIASGSHDPFYPGAQAFRAHLATTTPVRAIFGPGCHGGQFYNAHMPAALAFMNSHLSSSTS